MDVTTRSLTAVLLGGLGIAALLKPEAFFGVKGVFRVTLARSSPELRQRLERVIEARQDSEGASVVPARILGIFGLVTAALELTTTIDFVLPYALLCLTGGFAFLLRYLQIKRATERRVAMLTRRSPYASLSPLLIASIAMAFTGTALYLTVPGYRLAAGALVLFIAILGWVAWRLASSAAIVPGVDPELEYAVDERLRQSRVAGVVALASAPPAMLIALTHRLVDPGFALYASAALALVAIGCFVAMAVNVIRKFSMRPLNGTA
jgi:hypothetical protein